MNTLTKKIEDSSSTTRTELALSPLALSPECVPFLNWREDQAESEGEDAIVFRSLVATLKLQPALDDSLEAKAVQFFQSMYPLNEDCGDIVLRTLASFADESLRDFVQSIVVIVSSANHVVTRTAMKLLRDLILNSSAQVNLTLIKADLIPQLIVTLNPQSLSLAEAEDIHTGVISSISSSFWIATPYGLADLTFEGDDEQQAVFKTVLTQVVAPSEKYIWHLCMNRFSIINGDQSKYFLVLLVRLIQISSSYQPTMEFVLRVPVFLTIPSCLTFFENEDSINDCLYFMNLAQRQWNEKRGEERQRWKRVRQMLRMEGIEDVIEEKLQNDQKEFDGRSVVAYSIDWNNLLGMNLPRRG
ncbi:hypothetical protein BLNAU_11720 [Blattamonas nauphoetae]|uniref:Uncharacterized protein n=1 Tax=Blattamonas nauphoetae TaxID=2049346 RepID=A0ABQ9XLF2_9EUKA|nr:hypothetical protein BLNAU_11720 [Blattamonas nauphoetae]